LHKMTEEDLERIIIKLGDEKLNLRLNGGEKLHPIYEAVLALLKQHLTDEQIVKRMNDESDLKKILAIDSLIDSIPEPKRQEFQKKINSISNYNEILSLASLYLAENKRIYDGNSLIPVSDFKMQEYILRAIKKAEPENIFVNNKVIPDLEKRAKKIRKKMIRKTIALAVLSATVGAGVYFNRGAIVEGFKLIYSKENLKSEIRYLENSRSKLEEEIETEAGLKAKEFGTYEMLPKEYYSLKEENGLTKKIDDIRKKGEIRQVSFIYEEEKLSKVHFLYSKK